jgi:hypothetical protein
MAHYAFIDPETFLVTEVIVGVDEWVNVNGISSSQAWEQFYATKRPGRICKRTSYNSNIRAHYAGIGYTWDAENDVFYAPQPYPSWTLDAEWNWQAPVPYPDDGGLYTWDEATLSWVLVETEP